MTLLAYVYGRGGNSIHLLFDTYHPMSLKESERKQRGADDRPFLITGPEQAPISPDVSLTSASLIISCSWQTLSMLGSDHLPILIRLQMKTTTNPGLRPTYVNLKKENWDIYRLDVDATLSKRTLPADCQRDEKIVTIIIPKAASHHIPTGRHRLHEEHVPAEILEVMTRRDDLRKRDPTSSELPRLNKDIQKRICAHKRKKLRVFVENMDQKTHLTKLWKTIK